MKRHDDETKSTFFLFLLFGVWNPGDWEGEGRAIRLLEDNIIIILHMHNKDNVQTKTKTKNIKNTIIRWG